MTFIYNSAKLLKHEIEVKRDWPFDSPDNGIDRLRL